MGARPTFVGRERELTAVLEACSLGSRGARQVVFIGGEPGVGKSSIVAEIATRVDGPDVTFLLGTCVSAMGAPYQPFVEPMLVLAGAIEAGQLMSERPPVERERCLRALRLVSGRSGVEHPTELQSTRQLFEDCTEAFLAAARSRPVLLVLEDLHWAGETALQLLRYLVGHTADARLTILATQRTTAPDRSASLVQTVAQLYREDGVRRVDVAGLSTEEIAEFLMVEARISQRRALGAAALLRDLTGGNPFLLRDLWRELADRGGVTALRDIDLRAPESVLASISHRMAGLLSTDRRLVELAAVIGEEFPVSLLTVVARRAAADDTQRSSAASGSSLPDAAAVFSGMENAAAVGLLEPARGQDGVYRFPHGLARQAVLDLLSGFQRASDNACVARVLEFEWLAADLRVQRLAHHYSAAQTLGYAAKAVHYLSAAAAAAEAGLAHQEAARLYERAASAAVDPVQRDDLRLKAARSYLLASQLLQARELDEQVAMTAEGRQRLRAAIGFEAASWRSGEPGARSVALLTAALGGADLDPLHPLLIRGTAALGRAHAFTGNLQQAADLGTRSIALARETGDDGLLATALQISLQLFAKPGELAEKAARAAELVTLAGRIGDPRHLGAASYHRAAICYHRGDLAGLVEAHHDLAQAAQVTGQPFWEYVEASVAFGLHFLRADFAGASRVAVAGRELGRSFGPAHQPEGPFGLQSFMLRREIGALEQVRGLISEQQDPASVWAPGLLALYCELGMREPAARVLEYLLDRDLTGDQMSATWPVILSFLTDAATWLGDLGAARLLLPMVSEFSGLNLMGGEFNALVGAADRHLGALESLLGVPSAGDRFDAAIDMDSRMNSPVHLATSLAAAASHLRRGGKHPERAAELTEQARVLSARYGLARVDRFLADSCRAEQSRPRQPAGLTAREAEVLCLLGDGLSNRGIAKTLFISENTAANHVRSILIKTGAANRTQAAMYASSHGLLEQSGEPRQERSAGSARE